MYEVLYHYSSPSFNLIEIKRLDLSESSPKDQVYHWLIVDAQTGIVQKLTFKSMNETSRTFEEGFLELKGSYNTEIMKREDSKIVGQRLHKIVTAYLSNF